MDSVTAVVYILKLTARLDQYSLITNIFLRDLFYLSGGRAVSLRSVCSTLSKTAVS